MLRKKYFWIGLLIITLAAAGGAYWYLNSQPVEAAAEEPDLQTAVVRRGDIIVSATGAATIIPAAEVALNFPFGGVLGELLVGVGDKVQVGDVLARVDEADAATAVVNAQLQLSQAIMQTDSQATESGVSYNDIAIEQAQLNLDSAQTTLDELHNWEPDPDDIAKAEAALAAATAAYNAARGQEAASASNITVNNINREQAQRDLDDAQAAYDTAFDSGREWELNDRRLGPLLEAERDRAEDSLQKAQNNLAISQANYNSSLSSSNNSSSTNAQSNLLSAELALQAAQEGPTEAEITAAETAVRQAELQVQQAQLNQEADQISLAQAQLNVETAVQALADTELTAPLAGTIMSVNAAVGEQVGTAVFITLADLSQPMLELYLDETDLDKAGMGFEVEVVFDALPDETFSGHIVQVDPQLSQVSGVSAVRAVMQLDDFNKLQTLPVGLNATVEVIGGRAQNTLLVPVEAVREIAPGQFAVFVLENDEPTMKIVQVGLMDFTFAEIISGVEEGDEVTTGIIETGQ
ncbi:MAG: HlyD family efflux transporter periplasmic adaptor subunit [Chloroflexi bacterium]|nr:HlyD family efflux transporter periplasmic adaptor subunit [Chloroflexota bacterium]